MISLAMPQLTGPEGGSRTRWCCRSQGQSCRGKPNPAQHFSLGAPCKSPNPGHKQFSSSWLLVKVMVRSQHRACIKRMSMSSPAMLKRMRWKSPVSPPASPPACSLPWPSAGRRRRSRSVAAGAAPQFQRQYSTFGILAKGFRTKQDVVEAVTYLLLCLQRGFYHEAESATMKLNMSPSMKLL